MEFSRMSPHNIQDTSMDTDRNQRVVPMQPELVQIRSTKAEVSFCFLFSDALKQPQV